MKNKIKIPAILLYFISIFLLGFGIPLMIKADLGITVITSFPYALSDITGLFTVGMWVTIVQCVVLLVAIILLKRFTASMLASFITAYLLGFTIDTMTLAFSTLSFGPIIIKILIIIIASVITGIGAGMLVFSTYPPVPDLVFVRDVAKAKSISLSKMKVITDSSFFVLTVSLTLLTLGHVLGIGWGTLLSLIIIGFVVGQTEKLLTVTVSRIHFFGEENELRILEYNLFELCTRKNKKTIE